MVRNRNRNPIGNCFCNNNCGEWIKSGEGVLINLKTVCNRCAEEVIAEQAARIEAYWKELSERGVEALTEEVEKPKRKKKDVTK